MRPDGRTRSPRDACATPALLNGANLPSQPIAMQVHVDEVIEVCGVLIAHLRLSDAPGRADAWSVRLEQQGLGSVADAPHWVAVAPPVPRVRRRTRASHAPQPTEHRALVAFAEPSAQHLNRAHPVTVSVICGAAVVARASVEVTTLTMDRLRDAPFRATLEAALQVAGVVEPGALLSRGLRTLPALDPGRVEITQAVAGRSGLVLEMRVGARLAPALHVATADLRGWVTPSLMACRSIDLPAGLPLSADDDPVTRMGFTLTAVIASSSHPVEQIYIVESDGPTGEAVFHGPIRISAEPNAAAALALVEQAFGPMESLPTAGVKSVYDPLLRSPKTDTGARRYELGPAPAEGAPLTSIVMRVADHAFCLNNLYHLQRVLGPGYEVILVVDNPALWPEVYGRLLRRSRAMNVPTILLHCAATYGSAQASNLGIVTARGDVIVLMSCEVLVVDPAPLVEAVEAIRTRSRDRPEMVIGLSLQDVDGTTRATGIAPQPGSAVDTLAQEDPILRCLPPIRSEQDPGPALPAVTGGLIVLSARLCQSLNGFSALYHHQAFEDADLCLRARQKGAEIQVSPGSGLYHLDLMPAAARGDQAVLRALALRDSLEFRTRWDRLLSTGRTPTPEPTTAASSRSGIRVRKREEHGERPREGGPRRTIVP
jgi:hypothetical protein